MLALSKNQTQVHKNADSCTVHEYPLGDNDLNGAVAYLSGRYPVQGTATNTVCKEMAYVVNGTGKIVIDGDEKILNQGDIVLIRPGEKFYWDGTLTLFIACTPAWYPEQYCINK